MVPAAMQQFDRRRKSEVSHLLLPFLNKSNYLTLAKIVIEKTLLDPFFLLLFDAIFLLFDTICNIHLIQKI
jgi:hypothetical protein